MELFIGKTSTGKTYEMMKKLLDAQEPKKIYLVPEQYTLEAEKKIIETFNLKGLLDIEVLSFKRLSQKMLNYIGGFDKVEIDTFGKHMILRKILEKNKEKFVFYKKSLNSRGLIEQLCNLFDQMKDIGLDKRLLIEILNLEKNNESFKKKLEDILIIYEEFNKYSKDQYFDYEDQLIFIIENMHKIDYLKNTYICIDGFNGFSQLQTECINKLVEHCNKLSISLTLPCNPPYLSIYSNVFNRMTDFEKMGLDLNLNVDKYFFEEIKVKNKDISLLSESIFNYSLKRLEKPLKDIEGFIGSNVDQEVEQVALYIKKMKDEKKYQWRDIAVVVGSVDEYKSAIQKSFDVYNIPYFIDEKISILNNQVIQWILSFLRIMDRNFRYEDIFAFINTGFTELTLEEADLLEEYVKNYGIYGKKLWSQDFVRGNDKIDELKLKKINQIRKKIIKPLLKFYNGIHFKDINIKGFTIKLYEFIKEYKLVDYLDRWIIQLKKDKVFSKVNEYTQIWNILMKIIDQLVQLFTTEKLSLKEYRKILKEGFLEYEVGILPTLSDEIIIGDVHRSKIDSIKALFVLGINDGVLPSSIDQNNIFSEKEKKEFLDKGIDFKNNLDYLLTEENYLIYRLLSKPEEFLGLSYSIATNEGKSLRPSIIIDRIKQIVPEIKWQFDLSLKDEDLVDTHESTLKYLVDNLRKYVEGYPINFDFWKSVYEYYKENNLIENNWLVNALFYDNSIKNIDKNFIKELYELPLKVSETRLRAFKECPFKHFIRYGLKPYEPKEYKIEQIDLGLMFHKTLEEFGYYLKKNQLSWKNLEEGKIENIVDDLVENLVENYSDKVFKDNYRNIYFKQKISRVAKRSIKILKAHASLGEFKPKAFELKFSLIGEGLKPIVYELKNNKEMILEGVIDRLDVLEQPDNSYVKVIDYKSGYAKLSLSDFYQGLKPQLFIYLNALLKDPNYFGFNNLEPAGVYYFKIDDPLIENNNEKLEEAILNEMKLEGISIEDKDIVEGIDSSLKENNESQVLKVKYKKDGNFTSRSKVLDKDLFLALGKHVDSMIQVLGESISEGTGAIFPIKEHDSRKACDYCKYSSICQFDEKFNGNTYNIIKKYKDKDIKNKLLESGDENDSMDK